MSFQRNYFITISTALFLLFCGCEKHLKPEVFDSSAALSTELQTLLSKQQWSDFWRKVGSGKEIPLETNLRLSRAVQDVAYTTLETVLRMDARNTTKSQYDEVPFIIVIEKIFTEKSMFWRAYAEIANHAYGRNPKTGGYMYGRCSMDSDVWDSYYPISKIYILYYNHEFQKCYLAAKKFAADESNSKSYREFGIIIGMRCEMKLDKETACRTILSADPNLFTTPKHKTSLIEMKAECTSNSAILSDN